jgi:hypothetical protein
MNNEYSCPFLIICPGIHDLELTQDFLEKLQLSKEINRFNAKNTQFLIFQLKTIQHIQPYILWNFCRVKLLI